MSEPKTPATFATEAFVEKLVEGAENPQVTYKRITHAYNVLRIARDKIHPIASAYAGEQAMLRKAEAATKRREAAEAAAALESDGVL